MALTRRDFIKVVGIGAFAATTGCTKLSEFMDEGAVSVPPNGVEKWIPSVCGQCSGGCGIIARVIDGRVVKIEGNPLSPINRGTLCARGQAGLQVLYDPDRIRAPLRRVGDRGSDRWREIGWDEAIGEVAERLNGIRRKGIPHKVAMISGSERGSMDLLLCRFMEALGSPNYFLMPDDNDDIQIDAISVMQGIKGRPLFDISRARYILSFGSPLIETFSSPVQTMRMYGEFRGGNGKMRGRLVHISPRLSVTGIKADRWVPLRPGTEGVFALGIAHVIIKESLYDRDFISSHTSGFDGFREILLKEYTPSYVSKITSLAEDRTIEIAREFASFRPSLAIANRCRLYDQMAIHSLNALIGSIGKRGGIIFQSAPGPYALPLSERAIAMTPISGSPYTLSEAIRNGSPYSLEALLIYNCNPLFSLPDMHEASRGIPFIVSFSPFMNETARTADLILPNNTYLENWGDVLSHTAEGTAIGIRQPVLKPIYRTMQTGDVILRIARNMGGDIEKSMPWGSFKDALFYSLRQLRKRKGEVFGISKGLRGEEEFLEAMLAGGGYREPSDYQRPGEFDFHQVTSPQAVRDYKKGLSGGDEKDYPLYLNIHRLSTHSGITDYNQPYLKESLTPEIPEAWDSWVEINPETGKRRGISTGDMVVVESQAGRIRLRARLYQGIMPDVVSIPFGLGEAGLGRWNKNIGVNPEKILVKDIDLPSGNLIRNSTRVRIYRADG